MGNKKEIKFAGGKLLVEAVGYVRYVIYVSGLGFGTLKSSVMGWDDAEVLFNSIVDNITEEELIAKGFTTVS